VKLSTKWSIFSGLRYYSIGILLGLTVSVINIIIILFLFNNVFHISDTAIAVISTHAVNIITVLIILSKCFKRCNFYKLFGFAPGKSAKKQIATWKRIRELSLSNKDQTILDDINHLKLHEVITKIKGVELSDGGKKTQEISDLFSAIILADHFKIEQPIENESS